MTNHRKLLLTNRQKSKLRTAMRNVDDETSPEDLIGAWERFSTDGLEIKEIDGIRYRNVSKWVSPSDFVGSMEDDFDADIFLSEAQKLLNHEYRLKMEYPPKLAEYAGKYYGRGDAEGVGLLMCLRIAGVRRVWCQVAEYTKS